MNIKLSTGISAFFLLFCTSIFAEQLQVGPVYTDQADEVSFVITLPPGLESPPRPYDFQLLNGSTVIKNADAIEPFAESNRKLALLFCVDVSRSINNTILKETQDALINIFSGRLPIDKYQFGLVSFAEKVKISPDFTDDPDVISQSIRGLKRSRGKKTLLYQAIFDSLNKLNQIQPAEYRRILVISDGKDEGSIETADSIINLSKTMGIPIDTIGRGIIPQQYADGLSGLSKATGGRFIYPRAESMSLKEAVSRLNNSFIENTWVVYFKYPSDNEKPKLDNALIKFKQNDTLNLSATIPGGIPAPKDINEGGLTDPDAVAPDSSTDNEANWIQKVKEKLHNSSTYWILGLLLLITLIFILWLFRHRIFRDRIITPPPTLPQTDNKNIIEEVQPPRPVSRRQTEVFSQLKSNDLNQQNRPGIMLAVTEGPLEGHKIPITKPFFRIGANQDNDLVLNDDYVSRNHASITFDNGQLLLSDLHSRNGTLLNGVWVSEKASVILPGDVIRIGNSSLKVMAM